MDVISQAPSFSGSSQQPPRFGSISRQTSQEGSQQPNLNSLRYASASLSRTVEGASALQHLHQQQQQQSVTSQQPSSSHHGRSNRNRAHQQESRRNHRRRSSSSISSDEESETDDSMEYSLSSASTDSGSSCCLSFCCPSCITDNCNSQICCSYVIGVLSSALIVGGIYLSLIRWNRLWMSLSIFGFVLVFLGASLFYCGTAALNRKRRRQRRMMDDVEGNNRTNGNRNNRYAVDPGHVNRRRPYTDHNNRIPSTSNEGKRSRRRNDRRSLSQLSLNMIPQYFAPADTACQAASNIVATTTSSSSGHHHQKVVSRSLQQSSYNVSRSNTLLTSASVASSSSRNDNSSIANQGRAVSAASASVPFSQIFSLNGQSFLILPVETVIPTQNTTTTTPGSCSSSSVGVMTSVSQRNSLAMDSIPLDSLLVKVPETNCNSSAFRKPTVTEFLANLDTKSLENCQLLSKAASGHQTQNTGSHPSSNVTSSTNPSTSNPIKQKNKEEDQTCLLSERGDTNSLISLPSSSSSRPSVSLELQDNVKEIGKGKSKQSKKSKSKEPSSTTNYVTIVSSSSICSATNTTSFSPASILSSENPVQEVKQVPLPTVRGLRRKESFTIGPVKRPDEGEQVYENHEEIFKRRSGVFDTKESPVEPIASSSSVKSTPTTHANASSGFFISFPSSSSKEGEVKDGCPPPTTTAIISSNKTHDSQEDHLIENDDDTKEVSVRCKIPRFLGSKNKKRRSEEESHSTIHSRSFTFHRPSSESLATQLPLSSSVAGPSSSSGKPSSLIRQETFSKGKRQLIQPNQAMISESSSPSSSSSESSPSEEHPIAGPAGHQYQSNQLIDLRDDGHQQQPSTSRGMRYNVLDDSDECEGENFYHELDFDNLDGMDATGLLLLDETEYLSPPPSYTDVIENATDYPDSPTDHHHHINSSAGNDLNRPPRKGTL